MNVLQPHLIAEIGVNHDGDAHRAFDMVHAAAAAGFDAVKFQYWIVDELLAAEAPNAAYQGAGDQRDLLAGLALELPELAALRSACRELEIAFVCTADGARAHAEVMMLAPDALKVGSGDNDNPWLLDAVAAVDLPLFVSTGMSDAAQVAATIARLDTVTDVTVLHCVTAYPTPLADAGLGRIPALRTTTGRPVGYSDHTLGSSAAVAALALGATVIEKHVTWVPAADRTSAAGPDHAASLSLEDAPAWVAELRDVSRALDLPGTNDTEDANRAVVRKGLYASTDLAVGHRLVAQDLAPLRPLGDAVPASERDVVIGQRLARPVRAGEALRPADIEGVPA